MTTPLLSLAVSLLGQQAPPPAGTAAPATANPAAPAAAAPGGSSSFLIIAILMVAVMIGTSVWTQRREKKKQQALMAGLRKHDKVLTDSGIIGAIVEIKPDIVILKVDEASNLRITFLRSRIAQVLEKSGSAE